jgi:hypothetical protein
MLRRTSIDNSLVLNALEFRWLVIQLLAGFISNRWHRLAVDGTQTLLREARARSLLLEAISQVFDFL